MEARRDEDVRRMFADDTSERFKVIQPDLRHQDEVEAVWASRVVSFRAVTQWTNLKSLVKSSSKVGSMPWRFLGFI